MSRMTRPAETRTARRGWTPTGGIGGTGRASLAVLVFAGALGVVAGRAGASTDNVVTSAPALIDCVATTTTFTQSTPVTIDTGNPSVVTSTLVVSGAGPFLADVDVTMFLQHGDNDQLGVTVMSPAGTVVTLTSENGNNSNVFNGTVFDDKADAVFVQGGRRVVDTLLTPNAVNSPLTPEEPLAAFIGENPNGTWTMTISDDEFGGGGSLNSWKLNLTTYPTAPAITTSSFTQSTPAAIPDGGAVVTSTRLVSGAGPTVADLDVTTFITYPLNENLNVTLTSPSGTIVTLTSGNGFTRADAFNGTRWDDDANPGGQVPYIRNEGMATDDGYSSGAELSLTPEEPLGAFIGENPNGTWTLTISRADLPQFDAGNLASWTLHLGTAVGCSKTASAIVTTSATPAINIGSGSISDTATVTGTPSSAPAPTGTVTFRAYGPDDATCAGTPAFTSPQTLSGGTPPAAGSGPFTPTAAGVYRWTATYSGDANYDPNISPCNAPNETSSVNALVATLSTTATSGRMGDSISDTATVTGQPSPAPVPTGTVTFTAYGPDDDDCSGSFAHQATDVLSGSPLTAHSGPLFPAATGTYRWTATYSGDGLYAAVSAPCNAPGETSIVTVGITTSATAAAPAGRPISDTVRVTGAVGNSPTGTVVFTAYGPDDATCARTPAFTSSPRTLSVSDGPSTRVTDSGDFIPTAPGTYRWRAAYSGSASYDPVTTACNEPNETSVVSPASASASVTILATVSARPGQLISATTVLTGPSSPAPNPTGTVRFRIYRPADTNCTGTPMFISFNRTLPPGPSPATTASFTLSPTDAPGTYRWRAEYSGDPNYPPVLTSCNEPGANTVVSESFATSSISTTATASANSGQPISDTATVTGSPSPAAAPTGTVVFAAYGPENTDCTGSEAFVSVSGPLAGGPPPTAGSGNFTPSAPGTYRWRAIYLGDATYAGANGSCNDPGETSVVNDTRVTPTVSTTATASAALGQPISDTATLTGTGPAPTGTVTFGAFGPDDADCTGQPAFVSPEQTLAGGPPPAASSGDFTPTASGTYRWRIMYSGDTHYLSVVTNCNEPGETSVVSASVQADVSVTKTDSPDPVVAGQNITYTITVANAAAGSTAADVSLTDNIPANTTFVSRVLPSPDWSCASQTAGSTTALSCTRAALTPGDGNQVFTLVVRVNLQIPAATPVSNTATVSATGDTATSGNNVATATTAVTFAPSRPAVVRGSTGWFLRNSLTTGSHDTTFTYGTRPLVPLVGDWDGNGSKTAGTFSGGVFRLKNANDASGADITFTFGDPRAFPVAGDFNGDGTDDVALFRAGVWQIHYLGTGAPPDATFSFGPALSWPSVVPVAGDWNGDGTDGIGIYNLMSGPAGTWELRQTASGTGATQTVTYGGAGLYPIVGDWNGDGIDSLGTKAMTGTGWAVTNSNTAPATSTTFDFGMASDLPFTWR